MSPFLFLLALVLFSSIRYIIATDIFGFQHWWGEKKQLKSLIKNILLPKPSGKMKFLNAPYYSALENNNTEYLRLFSSELRKYFTYTVKDKSFFQLQRTGWLYLYNLSYRSRVNIETKNSPVQFSEDYGHKSFLVSTQYFLNLI